MSKPDGHAAVGDAPGPDMPTYLAHVPSLRSSAPPAELALAARIRAIDSAIQVRTIELYRQASADLSIELVGDDGVLALQALVAEVGRKATEIASRAPAAEWTLWATAFERVDRDLTYSLYEIGHQSENFGSISGATAQGFLQVPPAPDAVDLIVDAVSLWRVRDQLMRAERCVAKGMIVRLTADAFSLENPSGEPQLRRALNLFDARKRREKPYLGAEIGAPSDIHWRQSDDPSDIGWVFNSFDGDPVLTREAVADQLKTYDPYYVHGFSLDRLARHAAFITSEDAHDAMALRAATELCVAQVAGTFSEGMLAPGLHSRSGMMDFSSADFNRGLFEHLTSNGVHGPEAQASVARIRGRRTIFIPHGRRVIVDLANLRSEMVGAHHKPRTGTGARLWGREAEGHLQSQLDRSAIAPPPELRVLAGRDIYKYDSHELLTDIDAVAQIDGWLVLIDNKGRDSPRGLREGEDHSAVERRRKALESDAAKWIEKIDHMRTHPEVLGVGSVDSSAMTGLVLVPETPFVHIGSATEILPVAGLRRVTSVFELFQVAYGLTGQVRP